MLILSTNILQLKSNKNEKVYDVRFNEIYKATSDGLFLFKMIDNLEYVL